MTQKIVFAVCLIVSFASKGQNLLLIDSLRDQLVHAKGEERFNLLTDLSWEYRWAYPDSTLYYADSAYNFGQHLKLSQGLARPLNVKGVAYNYKGLGLSSFESYNKALKVALVQKDSLQIAHSNNNIGRLFFEQGLLSRAYEYFVKSLFIFKEIKDSSGLAYTYQSLANLYKSQKDFNKSQRNYMNALTIRLSLGNTRDIMSAFSQLGRLYQENNQHVKALYYFHKADSAGRVINDAINLAEIKTLTAQSFLSTGMLIEAEAICTEGLDFILSKENVRMLPNAYLIMGQIQLKKNNLTKAKFYFEKSRAVAYQLHDLTLKMEAHYFLWKLSETNNNKAEQLTNHNQYLVLKDSIKDLDLARAVERLQFEIDIQRKEQENELLKANGSRNAAIIQQQKLQNLSLIILVFLVSVLGFVQWLHSKKRREVNIKLRDQNEEIEKQREEIVRQNEKLSKRNQQLSDLNHEKDTLMSIVAHDLKSPLHRIKGVTDLLEMEGGLGTDQQAYVSMAKDATHAGLDLITDLLDVHMLEENALPSYSTFDISAFMLEKIKEFSHAAEAKSIHLVISKVESEEVVLDVAYLSRIMDNLISNAIKFSDRNSVVDVSAYKADSYIWIAIKDQGPGFSERDKSQLFQKFKRLSAKPTAGETSNGLGLAIVKTLVDRLKGEIHLTSTQNKGSEFIVKLPASIV